MYDYLQIKACQEIWNNASAFCNEKHSGDEVITYCLQTMNDFFKLHECTFFHRPTKMDEIVFEGLFSMFCKYLQEESINFSLKSTIGPQYTKIKVFHKEDESPEEAERSLHYKHNPDRRLTSKIPVFFGIEYTSGKKMKDKKGWVPSENPEPIMQEHRKLYDILFSYCYPSGNINDKESNTLLGNLAKPSIFRFDKNATGNYRSAFDYIQRELIYRFSVYDPCSKLVNAIKISLHTSQMRSVAFSIIKQLMNHPTKAPIPYTAADILNSNARLRYFDELYDYIIQKCEKINVITLKQYGKRDRHINPIDTKIKDQEVVLFYAYVFFSNLPTTDCLEEFRATISSNKVELDNVIDFSKEYIYLRDQMMLSTSFQQTSSHLILRLFIPYDVIDLFINDVWDKITPVICVDGFEDGAYKKFCKIHKGNMIAFIRLYTIIFKHNMNRHMCTKQLLDLLHLYVILKRRRIDIPTASIGYNKNNADEKNKLKPKPVKIDTAMELIQQKWNYQENSNEAIPSDIYMRTVIIETYLSSVMYMVIHGFSCNLFLKRIDATQKLFYALLQRVPSITLYSDKDVDFNAIAHELLDCQENPPTPT